MTMRNDIQQKAFALFAELFFAQEANVQSRLAAEEDPGKDLKCDQPELGKWIDACDFPFLIETLVLDTKIFAEEFPDVLLTAEERKEFAHALEAHCETCPRCSWKRTCDLQWQAQVDRAIAENKQVISRAIIRAMRKK